MDFITEPDLSALLELDLSGSTRAASIITRTNALITEKWTNPVDPPPASVVNLALTVAARAWWVTPGRGAMESLTRAFDDSSRTERFAVPQGTGDGRDVYLTDAELAILGGGVRPSRVGSIGLGVPGYSRTRTWGW